MMGAEGHRFGGLLRTLRDGILPLLCSDGYRQDAHCYMLAVHGCGDAEYVRHCDSWDNKKTILTADSLHGSLSASQLDFPRVSFRSLIP